MGVAPKTPHATFRDMDQTKYRPFDLLYFFMMPTELPPRLSHNPQPSRLGLGLAVWAVLVLFGWIYSYAMG